MSKQAWLGLGGNDQPSGTWSGPQDRFLKEGIVFTRHELQQGGDEVAFHVLLVNAAVAGFTSSVILEPSVYAQSQPYIAGSAIDAYAAWFVGQVQVIERLLPGAGTLYEIDNEPWGFYSPPGTAAQYADVAVAVLRAAMAAGLDLTRLFVVSRDAAWTARMYGQQPSLRTLVQGWTIHPYGPPPPDAYAGIASFVTWQQSFASGRGNILASEAGFMDRSISRTSGGEVYSAATAAQAGMWMNDLLEQASAYRPLGLRALILYHRTDGDWAMVKPNTNGALTEQGRALVKFARRDI